MAGHLRQFVPLGAQQEDEEREAAEPLEDKVVALINEAQLQSKDKKLECLFKVRELIINKDPSLLDSFFQEVTAFQQDPSVDVRKFVVGFMEDACKQDPYMLTQAIPLLGLLLSDSNINVQKRVIVCFMQLYRQALNFVSKMKCADQKMQDMLEALSNCKTEIINSLSCDNEGIRTLAIKFTEMVIICQTKKEPDGETPRSNDVDFSLDMITVPHPLLKSTQLREEAGMLLGTMLELSSSHEISSVNLMACVGTLTSVAKQRPSHIPTVVQAFELLQANLPITFTSSQISSVSKHLKSQVLGLLRLPASYECRAQINTLLTALGCSQTEISKNTPKVIPESNSLKRQRSDSSEVSSVIKKSRSEPGEGGRGGGNESVKLEDVAPATGIGSSHMEAIEMTASDLKPLLVPDSVIELVIHNMKYIPMTLPRNFQHAYTPIASAGSDAQVTHLARLLSSQMTTAGIGVGAKNKGIKPHPQGTSHDVGDSSSASPPAPIVSDPREKDKKKKVKKEPDAQDPVNLLDSMKELNYLGSLLGMPDIFDPAFAASYTAFFGDVPPLLWNEEEGEKKLMEVDPKEEGIESQAVHPGNLVVIHTTDTKEPADTAPQRRPSVSASPQRIKKIKAFNVAKVVHPMTRDQQQKVSVEAFRRILANEKIPAGQIRTKLVISLVTQFGGEFKESLLQFILDDFKSRFDLALAWLYTEYTVSAGYTRSSHLTSGGYDSCLTQLLLGARNTLDARDRLFTKLVLEAPYITVTALDTIKAFCREEERAFLGLCTLRDLIMKRTSGTEEFLQALLEVTMIDLELARVQALHIVKRFYSRPDLALKIERFAVQALQNLLADHPTFQQQETDIDVATEWSHDSVKLCSSLFLFLLPLNHRLLKELAIVYTNTTATVKRIILKLLDQPMQTIGMGSRELLELVAHCPHGAETLIMRILHILAETSPPSPELVQKVRELHQRNSSDVRFLIPVLHGLHKHEVLAALPMFIRLSPNVVKGVFEKLLVSYKSEAGHSMSPVTPSELLIALHNIDSKNDEATMRAVVKATNLCFAEKSVYTQEVLAVVLQHLMDQHPVPVLFMRTVIQSLGVCSRLLPYVMTVLTKLIDKQIWNQPKVWQGFIKCCEVTKPHSFTVLMKLPPTQLQVVMEGSAGLRDGLLSHLHNLTPSQRMHIQPSVRQVLEALEQKGHKERQTSVELIT